MKKYEELEIEVIHFDAEDVITASNNCNGQTPDYADGGDFKIN